MPTWKGIVGRGFTKEGFKDYVGSLSFRDWRPQFAVVHNTSAPRLSQWHSHPGEERMRNLEHFFRDEQGWSAGPHLFIADDLIWVFTPLITSGVHSPSWNGISWGVEMVGEYEEEEFSPAVRDNTVDALATLHAWRGLDPKTIRFHKEDPKTTHKTCPGRKVDKADLIARIAERIMGDAGEHPATRPEPGVTVPIIRPSVPTISGPSAIEGRFTNITATEFGGGSEAGMESAYGGTVNPTALEISLPARLPAEKRQVRVHHPASGRSVVCKVNDVGPWNTHDEYWTTTNARPRAEAQHRNRAPAGNGQVPTNDAGIDLTPAVFEALGVRGPVNTRTTHVDWEFV